ncbi:hypothetical protein JEOAER750_00180 [Jeotgalicoccus aerolatus]|uniref:Uncharacterized membrane protein YgdD (TMEM256/DUF423 family) n=1 Tax=Jeotgalicoccus aerolatus TaxID=709510 RepID=A0A1G9B1C9_9STAP|nr:DUF423 domain-containing protein [Jeotgalicoccus aerolatus]MBP1952051.1 uncharacterized membrane protein YgdD (TMEM256/DUF423 family) [Jeotgalicoccus aerolatus]NMA81883.1 DUF423 domain-containing protein [Jeotgalicoccus aerolatus]CAD2071172.1 hypothetical protein JEOAER750_00180 [Jeotgalicoccus aerolatus]SDK32635.1 Protein of unknown function [Jeotgalicoccus aerolatus]GGE05586.1 hypothetical protein GCM10007273_17460 [Jeotgalicoccus aerolatus]
MMFFIIVSIVCFLLTFWLSKYQNQLHEHYKKQWKKTVNYIRYTSFAILLAGLLYVPEAQILKISSWLLIFSMLLYFGSLFIIYNKNKSKK